MKLSFRSIAIFLSILAVSAVCGCTNQPPENVDVVFQGSSQAIDVGQSITVTVATANDNGEGVTFTCSGSACPSGGNLSAQTSTSAKFTATTAGTATITATSAKNHNVTSTTTITVTAAPSLTGGTLATATKGTAYNQSIGEAGGAGALTYTISVGSLPGGLSINSGTGVITGTPTGTTTGPITFTVKVTDSGNPSLSATAQYTITVQLPPGALTITTTSPLPAGMVGTTYSATISATGGTGPYTFSIAAGGTQLPTGLAITNSGNQGVISGTPTVSGTFTNILVSVHDSLSPTPNTVQMAFTLTISATPIVITPGNGALPNATQGSAYTQSISATGGVPPYTFTLDQSSVALPAGLTFAATPTGATISGTPTAAGTTSGIIVDVTDSSQGAIPVQVTYSLTVSPACGTGSESLINGQYAFLVKGYDNGTGTGETVPEPVTIGAALYTDGLGNVVAGDLNTNMDGTHGISSLGVTGTYQIGSDQRGCMSLTTSAGTQNYRISVANISSGVASTIHAVDFDAAGPYTSGVMLKQDLTAFSTSAVTGNYAFEISSPQFTTYSDGGKEAATGVFNLSNGTISGGEMDLNFEGQLDGATATSWSSVTPLAISSGGNYTVGSGNGLGEMIYTVTENGNPENVVDLIYTVSANEFLIQSAADPEQQPEFFYAGVALLQANSTFSNASLNGISVLNDSSLQVNSPGPNTVTTLIGTLTTDGSGGLNILAWQNNGAAAQNATGSATVQVAANGRVTFTTNAGANEPVFWLVGNNEGFLLGANANVESGFFEPQTATTVTTGTPYAFGSIDPELVGTDQEVGVATFSGGNVTGTTDDNFNGTVTPGTAFGPLTYSVSGTGLGSIPSGCTIGGTGSTGCQVIFYVISPTKGVWMTLLNSSGQVKGTPNQIANQ
jgi:hypothetical protein